MKLRFPFVTLKEHEAKLAEAEDQRRELVRIAQERHVEDVKQARFAVERYVANERARCLQVVDGVPASARGAWVRDYCRSEIAKETAFPWTPTHESSQAYTSTSPTTPTTAGSMQTSTSSSNAADKV
jgi:hypothetical protein